MTEQEKKIFNRLQDPLPIVKKPFHHLAQELQTEPQVIIDLVNKWLKEGVLSRFGPMYNVDSFGGQFILCAMKVPSHQWDQTLEIVNSFFEVAHNYKREHVLNMWFVVAGMSPKESENCIAEIQKKTGLKVYPFPKEQEFRVNLRFYL